MANYRSGRGSLYRFPACFSAPAPPPLPSWIVLDDCVAVGDPPLISLGEEEWALVQCAERRAYGCDQGILDGLNLYVRLVKPGSVTSALYIDVNPDALQKILAQFNSTFPFLPSISPTTVGELRAWGTTQTADASHMVMVIQFHLQGFIKDLIYYVIYDAVDTSLAMVPCPPNPRPIGSTVTALTLPHDRGEGTGGGRYSMVIMSQKMEPPPPQGGDHSYGDVLYMWAPSAARSRDAQFLWEVKGRPLFPQQVQQPFFAESAFPFQGKLFFVDLSQGLLCFDLATLNGSSDVVSLDFTPLPPTVPSATDTLEDIDTLNRTRTVACVQGSIRFLSIDHSVGPDASFRVTLWVLNPSTKCWEKDQDLLSFQLWKWFNFKKKRLPETRPKFPIFMPDGTVSFLIPRLCMTMQDPSEDYICNLDLNRIKFRWLARLDSCCNYTAPILLPRGFFRDVTPNHVALRMEKFM